MCQKRREVKNSDSRGDVRKRQSVNDKRPLSSHRPITAVITLRRSCQTLLHETHQSLAIIQVFRECPCSHASAASLYCSWVFLTASVWAPTPCFPTRIWYSTLLLSLHICPRCTCVSASLSRNARVTENSRESVRETPAGWRSTVRMCYWLAALNELE